MTPKTTHAKLLWAVVPVLLLALAVGQTASFAQTTVDPVATTTGPENTVQYFFVACGDVAVVNLSGNMLAGFDVYYQVFEGAGGTGTPLTSLRRINASGAYSFSERIGYNDGRTLATGATASMTVLIARVGNTANPSFSDTVQDVQDGCNDAQNPLQTSTDDGVGGGGTTATSTTASQILAPFGGVLNANLPLTPEPSVVIGPRQQVVPGRSSDPGLIFAECDSYLPQAEPGIVFDSDNVRIFWSWFASTPEGVEAYQRNAIHAIRLNGAPLEPVIVTPTEQRGRNFWTFYVAQLGNLRPGHYEVEFKLDFAAPINDGFADYGPGTANPRVRSLCNFDVAANPTGARVVYNGQYLPGEVPAHDFRRNIERQRLLNEFLANLTPTPPPPAPTPVG